MDSENVPEHLDIPKTKDKPHVLFTASSGSLLIEGESYPENAQDFYRPIVEMLEAYCAGDHARLLVEFKLQYFNSSSSKCLLNILDLLEEFAAKGGEVTVNWFYEEQDEDLKESGEDFADGLAIPFNIVGISLA